MKVYIAGPMRGLPQFNFPAFHEAERLLVAGGHEVFSPAQRDLEVGFDPSDMDGTEDLSGVGFSLREALSADLRWITENADVVAVLPGWEQSSGAKAEVATARALGLEVRIAPQVGLAETWDLVTHRVLAAPTPMTPEQSELAEDGGASKGTKLSEMGAVDPLARNELAKVAGFGGRKYARGNYMKGAKWSAFQDALHRHLMEWEAGLRFDEESGLHPLAHAAWQCLALVSHDMRGLGTDDRFAPTAIETEQ